MSKHSNKSHHGTSQQRARDSKTRKLSNGVSDPNLRISASAPRNQRSAGNGRKSASEESGLPTTLREAKGQIEAISEQASDMASKATRVTTQAISNATKVTGAAISKASHSAMETISANPIPIAIAGLGVAMTGVGITWLLMSGANKAASASNGASADASNGATHGNGASMLDGLSQRVQSVKQAAQSAGSKVSNIASQAGTQAVQLEQRLESVVKEHPVAAGATLLAVGAAIGLAIPRSALEDTWLGRERDHLFEATRRFAQSSWQKIEGVAQAVMPAIAGDSAQA